MSADLEADLLAAEKSAAAYRIRAEEFRRNAAGTSGLFRDWALADAAFFSRMEEQAEVRASLLRGLIAYG